MSTRKKISIRDVAASAGVSLSTASLALHNDPRVTDVTRRRVLDAAASLHYVPDVAASQLRRGMIPPVGLLFNQDVLAAGEMSLSALGFAIEILTRVKREVRVLGNSRTLDGVEQLKMLGCREIIIFNRYVETHDKPEKVEIQRKRIESTFAGVRVFAINYCFFDDQLPISHDIYRFGIHRARVQQLFIEAFLRERTGKVLLFNTNAIPRIVPDNVLPIFDSCDSSPYLHGRKLADLYMTQYLKSDVCAVMFGDDRVAAGFLTELAEKSKRTLDKLALASFDDLEFDEYLTVPLTSWAVPLKQHLLLALAAIVYDADVPREIISVPQFSWRRSLTLSEENRQQFEARLRLEFTPADNVKEYLKYFNTMESK